MMMFLSIVLWILLGWVTSYFAQQRGRDPMVWFLVGMFLGILGLLLLFILPVVEEPGSSSSSHDPEEGAMIMEEPAALPFPPFRTDLDWYYIDQNHQQFGPVSFDLLKKSWDAGSSTVKTYVWNEEMSDWKKIGDLPELQKSLDEKN